MLSDGRLSRRARPGGPALIADATETLTAQGALEVVADADAGNAPVIAELEEAGFVAVRSRILFTPA